ncbi:diphthine--ammonia ligase [Candidatus Aerophobetes bacterium]|nr:diphthine--ammonia ligase [Candidatus Aerophobetes bacterium]
MDKKTIKAFCSWSGGKESALSLYRAKLQGIEINYLLNMAGEDGKFSRSHGLSSKILRAQAGATGISLVQSFTSWEDYEKKFKNKVFKLKEKGIKAGVFGDIDLEEHKNWVERVCREIGIKPILPLWKNDREKLLEDFIEAGFKAIVVNICCDFLDESWLGRQIDREFVQDLKSHGKIDLCGEKGEYHSFVFDGPIFNKRIKFKPGEKLLRENRYFLEVRVV